MALTVPGEDELQIHMHQVEAFSATEMPWVEDALQRATDLMEAATNLHEDPEDELAFRIMTTGILAMSHAIFVTGGEDREALYSPYSSERMGSYSYSKMMQAVQENRPTGVPEFDFAVSYLLGLGLDPDATPVNSVAAEDVFDQPLSEYEKSFRGPEREVELLPDAWGN